MTVVVAVAVLAVVAVGGGAGVVGFGPTYLRKIVTTKGAMDAIEQDTADK